MSLSYCSVENCLNKPVGRGYCNGHLIRLRKFGDVREEAPLQKRTEYPSKYPFEYKIYRNVKARLYNPKDPAFKNYGGRGLVMDDAWRYDFQQFIKDVGARPSPDLTLDRIDNNLGYVRGNMRWASRNVQARNQRKKQNTSTGHKGVFKLESGHFIARVGHNHKKINLGTYLSLEEAIAARQAAERYYWRS